MKNSPYARGFLVKIKLFKNYIRQRQNIYVARYQFSLGIYRRIYPAVGVCNIPAALDISGTWRLRVNIVFFFNSRLKRTECIVLQILSPQRPNVHCLLWYNCMQYMISMFRAATGAHNVSNTSPMPYLFIYLFIMVSYAKYMSNNKKTNKQ